MSVSEKPLILITGVSSEIGKAIVKKLRPKYTLVGFEQDGKDSDVPLMTCDLTQDSSVHEALDRLRNQYGAHLASVIHLAGYYDFTGKDDPLYHTLNVAGTRRLLNGLAKFRVEQFVYSGTMLVHKAADPGEYIDEERELLPRWIYPQSKAEAEEEIRSHHGNIPYVLLHLAGVYSDTQVVPTLAHQIADIYERKLQRHLYPGKLQTGQSMLHQDDMARAFLAAVERRDSLPEACTILIGEPEPMPYEALQDRIGELLHGKDWTTVRVPAVAAAAGAWVEEKVMPHLPEALGGGKEPFVRPFMAWEGSDSYALDISRAKELLGWQPEHSLNEELPSITANLQDDPAKWYKKNKIGHKPLGHSGPSDNG